MTSLATAPLASDTAARRGARPRSMLFVSGEKPERFLKAAQAGADLVCIDLEDAVAPALKDNARREVLAWIAAQAPSAPCSIALRVNNVRTGEGLKDLLALRESAARPEWLLLPKTECATELQCVASWLTPHGEQAPRLAALLETPQAIEDAARIASAGAPLGALLLGGADLSAELGARFDWDGLYGARARLVNAARTRRLQAWDVPRVELDDAAALRDETARVIGLGFDCKMAIHPKQIAEIHAAFAPAPPEVDWALALLREMPAAAPGAFLFRGRMVDAPVIRRAQRVAELAADAGAATVPSLSNLKP